MGKAQKLLIVGDNELYQEFKQHFEGKVGLIHARTGEEALKISLLEHPEIILMDIQLDHGKEHLDGIQVLNLVKKEKALAGIKVIMYCTFLNKELEEVITLCGADAYLKRGKENLQKAIDTIQSYLCEDLTTH